MNDNLDIERIEGLLTSRGCGYGRPLSLKQDTDSTNDDARRAVQGGATHGSAFLAELQRAGRGRGNHRWHSPARQNIYLSMVLQSPLPPASVMAAPLVVGVVLSDLVNQKAQAPVSQIKWPNDVYVGGRKIAGVLVEAMARAGAPTTLVVGLGLNVLTTDFEPPLDRTATSLKGMGLSDLDRNTIVADLLAALEASVEPFLQHGDLRAGDVHRRLVERDWLLGKMLSNGSIEGRGAGIDRHGRLLLKQADGRLVPVVSGEVTLQ